MTKLTTPKIHNTPLLLLEYPDGLPGYDKQILAIITKYPSDTKWVGVDVVSRQVITGDLWHHINLNIDGATDVYNCLAPTPYGPKPLPVVLMTNIHAESEATYRNVKKLSLSDDSDIREISPLVFFDCLSRSELSKESSRLSLLGGEVSGEDVRTYLKVNYTVLQRIDLLMATIALLLYPQYNGDISFFPVGGIIIDTGHGPSQFDTMKDIYEYVSQFHVGSRLRDVNRLVAMRNAVDRITPDQEGKLLTKIDISLTDKGGDGSVHYLYIDTDEDLLSYYESLDTDYRMREPNATDTEHGLSKIQTALVERLLEPYNLARHQMDKSASDTDDIKPLSLGTLLVMDAYDEVQIAWLIKDEISQLLQLCDAISL